MKIGRIVVLLMFFTGGVPLIACDAPTMPRIPTQEEEEDEQDPKEEDQAAFFPIVSEDPFLG